MGQPAKLRSQLQTTHLSFADLHHKFKSNYNPDKMQEIKLRLRIRCQSSKLNPLKCLEQRPFSNSFSHQILPKVMDFHVHFKKAGCSTPNDTINTNISEFSLFVSSDRASTTSPVPFQQVPFSLNNIMSDLLSFFSEMLTISSICTGILSSLSCLPSTQCLIQKQKPSRTNPYTV